MAEAFFQNQKMEKILRRQRARATVSSLLISSLLITVVALLLALVLIPRLNLTQSPVVAYRAFSIEEEKREIIETVTAIERKPAAPMNITSRVIAANLPSDVTISVPEFNAETSSVSFGNGDDFGDGWGEGGPASGAGGTTFFGVTSLANRVAFVIDYSASMQLDGRVDIMKRELQNAVEDLAGGTQFQMIFFAGPVWIAGSEILGSADTTMSNVIRAGEETFEWVNSADGQGFEPRGALQTAPWIQIPELGHAKKKIKLDTKKTVRNTPLVWGTRWKYALEMALAMEPTPQVIYFMTDGATGTEAMTVARSVGDQAKAHGITINTVAMMEPRANEAMFELATRTNGTFTVVESGNRRRVVEKLP